MKRQQLGGEREQRLIDGALQSAERAKMLVQRLLAFASRQRLTVGPVDLAKLVEGMLPLIRTTIGPQIELVLDMAENLPPAVADDNQIEMALLNICVNARDAMPEGGTLTLMLDGEGVAEDVPALKAGSYLRLSARDTGAGMDPATLARAIEPFFSTKGVGKGTGLGLSMVHGLASQLGGALTLASVPGAGTLVQLWLPAGAAEAAVPVTLRSLAPPEPIATKGRILLVDDEALVRMTTNHMLEDLGYAIVEAGSAEEALELLARDERVDAIVTDHLMPGMTGADLVRTVRRTRPSMPALIVSGYSHEDGVIGDIPRLMKPFRQAELAARVAAMLAEAEAVEPDANDAERLYSVLYVSRCRLPMADEALDALVTHARGWNRKADITGALLFTHEHFAQCLEGGHGQLDLLMSKIKQDDRHEDLIVLRSQEVARRSFAKWSMAYSGASNYAARQVADAVGGQEGGAGEQTIERLLWMMKEFAAGRP